MKYSKFLFLASLLLLCVGDLSANQTVDMPNNVITKEIDLKPLMKSFKKSFSKKLNKRDCEKNIFVKKAKLNTEKQWLVVDFNTRITRQYCTRRAKKQLYEKTKSIRYKYAIKISESGMVLVETSDDKEKSSFEKSLKDVMGQNPKTKIAEILVSLIDPEATLSSQSLALGPANMIYNVNIISNKILVEFSTIINDSESQQPLD